MKAPNCLDQIVQTFLSGDARGRGHKVIALPIKSSLYWLKKVFKKREINNKHGKKEKCFTKIGKRIQDIQSRQHKACIYPSRDKDKINEQSKKQ